MANFGKHILTNSNPQEINAGSTGINNGEIARIPAMFFLRNEGPDRIYLVLTDSGLAPTDGYPIDSGEQFKFGYVGSVFIHCPTASSMNNVVVSFITSNVLA